MVDIGMQALDLDLRNSVIVVRLGERLDLLPTIDVEDEASSNFYFVSVLVIGM